MVVVLGCDGVVFGRRRVVRFGRGTVGFRLLLLKNLWHQDTTVFLYLYLEQVPTSIPIRAVIGIAGMRILRLIVMKS